jgi:hypothetical protein
MVVFPVSVFRVTKSILAKAAAMVGADITEVSTW